MSILDEIYIGVPLTEQEENYHYKKTTKKMLINFYKSVGLDFNSKDKKKVLWNNLIEFGSKNTFADLNIVQENKDTIFKGVENIVIEDGLKFAIVKKGYDMYKAMPSDARPGKYFKTKNFPEPSFYGEKDTAEFYNNLYFPNDEGKVFKFRTTRKIKLFVLNDVDNIIKLGKLFKKTKGIKGVLKNSKEQAIEEMLMVVGLNRNCYEQNKFRSEIEEKLNLNYDEYKINPEICALISNEKLQRLSLFQIDVQFSKNLCKALSKYNNNGYIATKLPTAFGIIAPVFHNEIMLCFTPDSVKKI